MIRMNKSILVEGNTASGTGVYYVEGACVAADASDLPTDNVAMGSKVYIVDNGKWAFYNEAEEKLVDDNGDPLS